VQTVGGGLSGLAAQFSDESALKVCIHVMRNTNRRLYFTLFYVLQVLLKIKPTLVTKIIITAR